MADRYIVTMYRDGDCITRFAKYGRQGHIEAIEAADWDVHHGHARRATVERELPGGGMKMVYERTADTYEVTGVDRSGRRFKYAYSSAFHAMGINLWRGSVWHVRDGKRKLIKRVSN